jgi:hypothetical protein
MSKKINISGLKQPRIRKSYENGIEIYNLTEEERKPVIDLLISNINAEDNNLKLSGEDIIIKLLPIYTNIYLDVEDNRELLGEIIHNPSDVLDDVIGELAKIIKDLSNKLLENIESLSKLSPEELNNILSPKVEEELSKEEIEMYNKLQKKMKKLGNNI